jgi:hypothetical protein
LQINAVEPYGWKAGGSGGSTGEYNVAPNTKAGLDKGSAK